MAKSLCNFFAVTGGGKTGERVEASPSDGWGGFRVTGDPTLLVVGVVVRADGRLVGSCAYYLCACHGKVLLSLQHITVSFQEIIWKVAPFSKTFLSWHL